MSADVAAADYHPPIVIDPNTGSIGWNVFNPLTGGTEMIFRRELSDGLLSLIKRGRRPKPTALEMRHHGDGSRLRRPS